MTLRKDAPRAKSRWLALMVATVATTALVAGAAFALVQGTSQPGGFEIEGNMTLNSGTYDWSNAGGATGPTTCSGLSSPGSAGPLGPLSLFCSNDKPTGQTDNSLNGHEQDATVQKVCGSIPNNKSDLTNFYVASQSVTVSGSAIPHSILYLGWTRTTTLGSADMDFEFNQAAQDSQLGDSTCASGNGQTIQVNSHRTAGDLLIQYLFGGNTISVQLSRWITDNSTDSCATSQSAPCWATPVDLTAANEAQAAINDSGTTGAFGCITANGKTDNGCITNALSGGTEFTDAFGEAAIDLTAALSGEGCTTLGSAYLKSRSSAVLTDAMKDYIAPIAVNISNCVTPTLTTALSPNPATVTVGTSVSDTATLSGFLGSNPPGGTVTFNVYSGTGSTACTGTPTAAIAGSALGTSGSDATSTATITDGNDLAPGHYEVQASYSGDGGANLASTSTCGSEPIQINKKQPGITTQDSPTTAITVGTSTSVSDTATFADLATGIAPDTSVKVSFQLFSNDTCTTAVTGVGGDVTITGSGPYTATYSTTWTPTVVGTYYWGVKWAGDSNYLKIPASGTWQCGGTGETLTVQPATPSVSTQIHLDDKATISGGYNPTGTVTFQLYANNTCSGSAVATFNNVAIVSGVASTVGLTPSSGDTFVSSGNTYSWKVTYNSNNSNNNSVTVGCTVANHEEAAISYAGQ